MDNMSPEAGEIAGLRCYITLPERDAWARLKATPDPPVRSATDRSASGRSYNRSDRASGQQEVLVAYGKLQTDTRSVICARTFGPGMETLLQPEIHANMELDPEISRQRSRRKYPTALVQPQSHLSVGSRSCDPNLAETAFCDS